MKRNVLVFILLTTFLLPAMAQCPEDIRAFKAGETLDYEMYFNWKFVWVKAGTSTINTSRVKYQGRDAYKTYLYSTGNKRADFFFKLRNTLISFYTPNMVPLYFKKASTEGKRYTEDEVWYNYKNGATQLRQRFRNHEGKVSFVNRTSHRCVYDMMSMLFRARSFDGDDFRVGQRIVFPMATGKNLDNQTIIYRGKKVIKANDKRKYRCMVFSFVEPGKRGKWEEVITFFITDDPNHIPVRLDMYLNFGSAKAFLKSVSGNRYPITAIVK